MAIYQSSARILVQIRRRAGHAGLTRVAAVALPQPARSAASSATDIPACRSLQRVWPWGSWQLWAGERAQGSRGCAVPRRAPILTPCSPAAAQSSAKTSALVCLGGGGGGGAGKRPLSMSPPEEEKADLVQTTWVDSMPTRVAAPPPTPPLPRLVQSLLRGCCRK